ncbi:hypothetical protein L3Q82_008428 [Scortum barcoo]|uniref:Uncharacterized protein n=1 Tax=Scortum barcoo TaxID=214431 RepID=A0ACB8XC70_9TELE|nr:hypothetical protein L3Q82_008428 [Scortum barcoo]
MMLQCHDSSSSTHRQTERQTDMLPKTRLGKRSPLGALLSSTCPTGQEETGDTGVTMATAAGHQAVSRVKGHTGLKVYFQCGAGGGESPGVVDQLDVVQSDVSVWSSCPPCPPSTSAPPSCSRSVSSCINVPRSQRSPQEVDMDELMAAMVLSSLSCSPLLHSPAHPDTPARAMDCGGGELSDSGSSGYWSVGHSNGSPAPSPDNRRARHGRISGNRVPNDPRTGTGPRSGRTSVKAAYRCLWPSCEKKVLTSVVVGIKRHIRTTHLCSNELLYNILRGGEHERCSRSEEDFYYTEINQYDQQQQAPPTPLPLTCGPPSSPPSPPSPPLPRQHSYQAPPPVHVMSVALSNTPPCRWTATPTSCLRQDLTFRVRSVSVGEQWLQHQSAPCRSVFAFSENTPDDVCLFVSGGFAVKLRNVVKFTASSTETSGVRPVAGRKPANASSTEQRTKRREKKKERKQERKQESQKED